MRGFAVSNIAWPFADRLKAYRMMVAQNVLGLEIAPGMLFADSEDVFDPPVTLIRQRLAEIADIGLTLVSMQSLLYGVKNVALFGEVSQRRAYVSALGRAIRLAGKLSIPHLVLGSPRERAIPQGMTASEAEQIATEILAEVADLAQACDCSVGLEPNPAIYGTNFATHTAEAARIVRNVARQGLCLTLDTGNLQINNEMPGLRSIVVENADIIGHVHLSEPGLALSPADAGTASTVISTLEEAGFGGWLSLEMRAANADPCDALGLALARLNTARNLANRSERLSHAP